MVLIYFHCSILLVTHVVGLRSLTAKLCPEQRLFCKKKRKSDHSNFSFLKLCMCFCYLLTSFCNYWEIDLNKLLIFIYMLKSAGDICTKITYFLCIVLKMCSISLSLQSSFYLTEFRYFQFIQFLFFQFFWNYKLLFTSFPLNLDILLSW